MPIMNRAGSFQQQGMGTIRADRYWSAGPPFFFSGP
jgi:hypothetical protein